jgi:hypothetical protein
MKIQHHIITHLTLTFCLICSMGYVSAQNDGASWEKTVFMGYNLGGTSPLPLPREIRKVNSWNPGFGGSLAFHVTRWFNSRWGATSGLAIDVKSMNIDADVLYMQTRLVVGEGDQTGSFSGVFSGKNTTKVRNGYLVIPVLAAYRPAPDWVVRFGGYFASTRDTKFEGTASDGYIRNGDSTGDRINVEKATFDFSDKERKADAGLMASADWFFSKNMAVTGQLSWGLVPLFPSDFNGITYKMYNIYFLLGIAYDL